ncbi:MAG: phenylacetate--CoA ligase family protein [Candidatus Bathyarchaeota archaeon]
MPNFPRLLYYLAGAMRRVYWKQEDLKKYQKTKLRSVIDHAYKHVPFYHKMFKTSNIKPSHIKSAEDLSKLPLLRKADLRSGEPTDFISSGYDIQGLKAVRTSGSTGQPLQIHLNKKEDDWRKAIYMRANINCGQKPRDNWTVITAPHHFFDTTKIQRLLGVFAQDCVSVFNSIDEQIHMVKAVEPDIIDGYSGSILLFAKEVEKRGVKDILPRMIFGTADLIDPSSRRFIEDVFAAPYYDQFGCGELDRTAWQCPEQTHYHIDVDSVIMEFVDDDGNQVAEGEEGEILYTSLFNYAQPLIRYAVGDVGVPVGGFCSCGRTFPLMKIVEGRRDSYLTLPGGRKLSPMTFWTIMRLFKHTDQIQKFKIIQKKMDEIEILIKKKDKQVEEDFLEKRLIAHIEKCLKTDESSSVKWNIIFVDEIPLDKSGKLRSVISLLPGSTIK